ncbi:hypothetical protein AAC387_Pa07g2842 [Persea americana]
MFCYCALPQYAAICAPPGRGSIIGTEGEIHEMPFSKAFGTTGALSSQPSTAAPAALPISSDEVTSQALALTSAQTNSDGKASEVPADAYDRAASDLVPFHNLEQSGEQILDDLNPERAVESWQQKLPLEQEIRKFYDLKVCHQMKGEIQVLRQLLPVYQDKLKMSEHERQKDQHERSQELLRVRACALDCQRALEYNREQHDSDRNQELLLLRRTAVSINEELLTTLKAYEHELMEETEVAIPAPLSGLADSSPPILQSSTTSPTSLHMSLNEGTSQARASTSTQTDSDRMTTEDLLEQAEPDMRRSISVTLEEEASIERLEAMGFDRALVIKHS